MAPKEVTMFGCTEQQVSQRRGQAMEWSQGLTSLDCSDALYSLLYSLTKKEAGGSCTERSASH